MIKTLSVGTLLAVSYHSDKFGNNRYCDESDLMFLICHVTWHNHLFKWSWDFIIGSPSPWVTTLLILVASGIVVEEIKHFQFFT